MSSIHMTLHVFFHLPESRVDLPGLDQLQHHWHSQDSHSTEMGEPLGFPEGSLHGLSDTGMWHLVASLLASRAPPREWPDDSGARDTTEKVLLEVGEILEQPAPRQLRGSWDGCFLPVCKLRRSVTRLCDAAKLRELQGQEGAQKWCLEEDLPATEQRRQSPSPAAVDQSESEEDDRHRTAFLEGPPHSVTENEIPAIYGT